MAKNQSKAQENLVIESGNIVIHIGYHKSASTYLQKVVFPRAPINYQSLRDRGREFLDILESKDDFDPSPIYDWLTGKLKAYSESEREFVTVLSHEELSGHPHGYKSISPFVTANNLKELFPNARIVIIVRRQIKYMESLYGFRVAVKGSEFRSFSKFLSEEGEKGLFEHLEYHRLVTQYIKLFGRENVTVLPIELLNTAPDAFYKRLDDILKLSGRTFDNRQPLNTSTRSLILLSALRPINYIFSLFLNSWISISKPENKKRDGDFLRFGFYALKRNIIWKISPLFKRSAQLDGSRNPYYLQQELRFAKSNVKLSYLVGLDFSKFRYPSSPPSEDR